MTNQDFVLEAIDLAGGYGSRSVISEVDLSVQRGEWLSCVGPNGSGKSTLLRLLSRLLKPHAGQVLLNGVDLQTQKSSTLARRLAMLPQYHRIPAGISVRQLVSLGRSPYQNWWQWDLDLAGRQYVERALAQTRLLPLAAQPVEALSGGERQRAFLALALAQNPQVLLLDEPTTFLDLRYQLELLELLKTLNREQGLTVITVLHDLNLAARHSHRIALLSAGSLVALGSPADVLTPSQLQQVFGLAVELIQTSVGLQMCPLHSTTDPLQGSSPTLLNHHYPYSLSKS
ncbi:MAG: ABC transporter ATP-binding protein [Synechococcaceae cyanobacterium SM2_3_2]|nr:ABC transporter ATP-binding protein [Synechococcaceae cyanobacterium SM2_3_2]